MKPISTYEFEYNVPVNEDLLGKPDLFIPIKAELFPIGLGIKPLIIISVLEVQACELARLKSFHILKADCEKLANDHFQDELGLSNIEFNSLTPVI